MRSERQNGRVRLACGSASLLLDAIGDVTAQFSAWPTDANLLQLGAECLGALAASSNKGPAWTAADLAQFPRT